jgi:hypothetical protein
MCFIFSYLLKLYKSLIVLLAYFFFFFFFTTQYLVLFVVHRYLIIFLCTNTCIFVYFIELEAPNSNNNHNSWQYLFPFFLTCKYWSKIYFCKLKIWLRSRIREHRLTGLALLHVHTNIIVSINETINKFAKMKKRNLKFVIWLLTNLIFST